MENKKNGSAHESADNSEDVISSQSKAKIRGKKRKRESSDSSTDEDNVLPENTLEFEKNLHASAIKNNLDETSVKKILKKVVTNDHVLALVKLREEEENSSTEESHVPKLTRSKVKELKRVATGKPTWNLENLELTPIKHIPVKTRPEVKALIAQELPEDEDDDEYQPTHDDVPSDDDQTLESCSDLDSQPRTPATPHQIRASSPRVVKDGPFKVPQEVTTPARRKLELEEEATIALRTRSKLSLSETPIEHIESSFVPPDDLPMPDVDDLWNNFLVECLDPAPTLNHEDEDETDPEYNVAADPDAHDEDEEALESSIIKISKKELNDLVTELFSIMPEVTEDSCLAENIANSVLTDQSVTSQSNVSSHWEGKQEPLSDDENVSGRRISDRITFERRDSTGLSIGKMEPQEDEEEPQYLEIGVLPAASNKVLVSNEIVVPNPPAVRELVCANTPTIQIADGKPMNVVNIVVGQNANTLTVSSIPVPIENRPPNKNAKVPIPLLRHHNDKARSSCRQKSKITRVEVHMNSERCILPEQIIILQQQLRMHIQLAASNFMQLFVHPLNYGFGPTYKEFIESLVKIADKTPNSVVDVCNLRPAMELVNEWEKKVSQNTPENTEYIQYIQDDCAKWARYVARNNYYVGDFHVMFKKAVAESPVFLYPYLLPPRPYHNRQRRNGYLTSEDELIALGLDQFWQYVVDNPNLYPPPKSEHPRQRWWLNATIELIWKHMLPFLTVRMLLSHLHNIRKKYGDDNPINKFFSTNEVRPVEHNILTFNPTATLYDQPVEEMPRLWLKYLAKTDAKYRKFLNSKHKNQAGAPSKGIPIQVNLDPSAPVMKQPLPLDFTKEIVTVRRKKRNVPTTTADSAQTVGTDTTNNTITTENTKITDDKKTTDNTQTTDLQTPEGVATNVTNLNPLAATNIYRLEDTSTGQQLVPLIIQVNSVETTSLPAPSASIDLTETLSEEETYTIDNNNSFSTFNTVVTMKPNATTLNNTRSVTNTVNSNQSPITSTRSVPVEKTTSSEKTLTLLPLRDKQTHCKCCILLRKVCQRQTRITEYFNKEKPRYCFCKEIRHPKITKKLIRLVNTFKDPYRIAMENLSLNWAEANEPRRDKLNKRRKRKLAEVKRNDIEEATSTDVEDLAYVINYKMKLMARLGPSIDLKFKVHGIFSKFDPNTDDPLSLAVSLYKVLTGHHSALFRDFLAFLTAEQAARMGKFRDYFTLVRIGELVKMVEEEIVRIENRRSVLNELHKILTREGVSQPSACEICTALLPTFENYPRLAERVFKLFPHNIAHDEKRVEYSASTPTTDTQKGGRKRKTVIAVTRDSSAQTEVGKESEICRVKSVDQPSVELPIVPTPATQSSTLQTLTVQTIVKQNSAAQTSGQEPTDRPSVVQMSVINSTVQPSILPPVVQSILVPPTIQPIVLQPLSTQPLALQPSVVHTPPTQTLTIDTSGLRPPENPSTSAVHLSTLQLPTIITPVVQSPTVHPPVVLPLATLPLVKNPPKVHLPPTQEELDQSDATMCGDSTQTQDEADVTLTNDDQMQVDYEADHSSSGEEEGMSETEHEITKEENELDEDYEELTNDGSEEQSNEANEEITNGKILSKVEYQIDNNKIQIFITNIKSEKDSDENTQDVRDRTNNETRDSDSELSMVIDSDSETIKSESSEWKRDEDKLILQVIKDNLALEERGDKPILEFIEDKQVIQLLSDSLIHKSKEEIRDRIIYLLQMLLLSEK